MMQMADVYAFVIISNKGKPAYWDSGNLSYRFHTNPSGQFGGGTDSSGTSTDEFDPIRNSFLSWGLISGLSLSITETASTSDEPSSSDRLNTIKWVDSGWSGLSFSPPSNALAVTILSFNSSSGKISDADIYFNADNFNWAVVDDPSESSHMDVQNVATHEIGHVLGLDHSSVSIFESDTDLAEATMYYASAAGETLRRSLNGDDTDGAKNLYQTSIPAAATITEMEEIDAEFNSVTYRITGTNFTSYTSFVLSNGTSSDVVSRYRTIKSSTEAEVQFDMGYFPSGNANLIAFNHPSQVSNFAVEVTGNGSLSATSAGGGGGCALSANVQSAWMLWLLAILMLACARMSVRKKELVKLGS
jgi:hypothetical protein